MDPTVWAQLSARTMAKLIECKISKLKHLLIQRDCHNQIKAGTNCQRVNVTGSDSHPLGESEHTIRLSYLPSLLWVIIPLVYLSSKVSYTVCEQSVATHDTHLPLKLEHSSSVCLSLIDYLCHCGGHNEDIEELCNHSHDILNHASMMPTLTTALVVWHPTRTLQVSSRTHTGTRHSLAAHIYRHGWEDAHRKRNN